MNEQFRVKRHFEVYCISTYSLHCTEVKYVKADNMLPLFNKLHFFLDNPDLPLYITSDLVAT